MTNIYGITFNEYLKETKDSKKKFKKRFKKSIKILERNLKNIENEIKNKGFNEPFNENMTLENARDMILSEIRKEKERYFKIKNL